MDANRTLAVDLPMVVEDKGRQAMVTFWWTSTLLKKIARRFFARQGSSEAQFNLLMALKYYGHREGEPNGPLTQNELSRMLLVDKSNITSLLDRMERDGLIRRNEVAGDRRSYHISLTDAGREAIDRIDPLYQEVVAGIMSAFTPEEEDELIRLTQKLRAALLESGL